MVSFEFIKPDFVNTGRHTNERLSAAHPVWVVKPQDTSLEEGKPGYLHCQAKASPEPEVTWTRNNLMLMPEVTHTHAVYYFFSPSMSSTCPTLSNLCFILVCRFLNNLKLQPTYLFFFFFTPPGRSF